MRRVPSNLTAASLFTVWLAAISMAVSRDVSAFVQDDQVQWGFVGPVVLCFVAMYILHDTWVCDRMES